jgi:hypothetical protein
MMECLCCEAQIKRGTAPFSIDINGDRASWDAISAWVYEQYGKSLFETQEVDAIQSSLAVLDRETVALAGK